MKIMIQIIQTSTATLFPNVTKYKKTENFIENCVRLVLLVFSLRKNWIAIILMENFPSVKTDFTERNKTEDMTSLICTKMAFVQIETTIFLT